MPESSWVELHVTQAHLDQGKISCHVATPSSGDYSLSLQFKIMLKSKMMVIEETAKIKLKRQYYLPWYKAVKSHFNVFHSLSFLIRIYLLYHFICRICTCTSLGAQQSEGTEIHTDSSGTQMCHMWATGTYSERRSPLGYPHYWFLIWEENLPIPNEWKKKSRREDRPKFLSAGYKDLTLDSWACV